MILDSIKFINIEKEKEIKFFKKVIEPSQVSIHKKWAFVFTLVKGPGLYSVKADFAYMPYLK